MEKNNNKLVIFLLIVIICLLACGGFLLYKITFNNSNSNTNLGESNNNNNQLTGESNNNVNSSENALVTYIDNIPQVNIAEASDFNKTIKDYYDRATKGTDTSITFSSVIDENILFCGIYYSYRAGAGGDFEAVGFTYDLVNNKTMKIKDILQRYNVNVNKLDIDEYQKETITSETADRIYYIIPSSNGVLEAFGTGMGAIDFKFYYK